MNIQRMSNEKTAPVLQSIQPEIERLKEKHKVFLESLKESFTPKNASKLVLFSSLEDYIAGKIQLLNNLQDIDAFYEIQSAQVEIAKDYYVELYNQFTQP